MEAGLCFGICIYCCLLVEVLFRVFGGFLSAHGLEYHNDYKVRQMHMHR